MKKLQNNFSEKEKKGTALKWLAYLTLLQIRRGVGAEAVYFGKKRIQIINESTTRIKMEQKEA